MLGTLVPHYGLNVVSSEKNKSIFIDLASTRPETVAGKIFPAYISLYIYLFFFKKNHISAKKYWLYIIAATKHIVLL